MEDLAVHFFFLILEDTLILSKKAGGEKQFDDSHSKGRGTSMCHISQEGREINTPFTFPSHFSKPVIVLI